MRRLGMFSKTMVAIVTPFKKSGEVDYQALFHLIEWHISQGVNGIVSLGTTGEACTLTEEEKIQVVRHTIDVCKKRVFVIVGTGTYDTNYSVSFTKKIKNLRADGCLVVVPYYNSPTPKGIYLHYKSIDAVGLPIILYHHPKRTGLRLSVDLIKQIYTLKNVVAIKEASGDLAFIKELSELSEIPILSGDDPLTIPIMELGGVGAISASANVLPDVISKIVSYCSERDFLEAHEIYAAYQNLIEDLFLESNPICIKYALSVMGKCYSCLRLPLVEPEQRTKERINESLSQFEQTCELF